jgi:capsular exopolysaccharide synthesis family protein
MNGLPPAPMHQQAQQGAMGPYLRAIKAHAFTVAIVMLMALLGSILWLHHRTAHYQATAAILFNPVPSNNEGGNGLPVLRESGDPTRLSQTAVSLLNTQQAAAATAQRLGPGWTAGRVAGAISVQVQGQSDIIAVTGEAGSAEEAQKLANAFASASLTARQAQLRSYAEAQPATLERERAATEGAGRNENLVAQERAALIAEFAKGQDPNFSLSQTAGLPGSPTGTPAWLVVVLSLIAGFAIGSVAAVVIEMVSDRVRESDELLGLYRLPVLAYVPALPRKAQLAPNDEPGSMLAAAAREAFGMVRVQLDAGSEEAEANGRTIMITSATAGDGKTSSTAAIGVALAEAGHRVILVDLDLRKPGLSHLAGTASDNTIGLTSLLDGSRELSDVLTNTENPRLKMLAAGPRASAQLFQPVVSLMTRIIDELRDLADYVVIDTAPLGEVGDAYQLLPFADDIIIIARPDNTRRASFQFMRDLLVRAHRTPRGIVIVGEGVHGMSAYYRPAEPTEGPLVRRWLQRARLAR